MVNSVIFDIPDVCLTLYENTLKRIKRDGLLVSSPVFYDIWINALNEILGCIVLYDITEDPAFTYEDFYQTIYTMITAMLDEEDVDAFIENEMRELYKRKLPFANEYFNNYLPNSEDAKLDALALTYLSYIPEPAVLDTISDEFNDEIVSHLTNEEYQFIYLVEVDYVQRMIMVFIDDSVDTVRTFIRKHNLG